MFNRISPPPAQNLSSEAPDAVPGTDIGPSIRAAGLTAGVGILLMSALAGFGTSSPSRVW